MASKLKTVIHPKGDFFDLKGNHTNVRTEVVAGLTTFFTMAYIIFVNPDILGAAKMDAGAVMLATCISAAIGTLLIGLLSNYPLAQAPGMGLNAFFAFTICGQYGYSWQAGLAAVFISGVLFILPLPAPVRPLSMPSPCRSKRQSAAASACLLQSSP